MPGIITCARTIGVWTTMERIMLRPRTASWLAAGLVICQFAGCSGDKLPKQQLAPVSGKVTYKGEPLKLGRIVFQPERGNGAATDIKSDGTYTLSGVVGKNVVTVASQEAASTNDKGLPNPAKSFIPEKYSLPGQSDLSFEVKDGQNKADFDLK